MYRERKPKQYIKRLFLDLFPLIKCHINIRELLYAKTILLEKLLLWLFNPLLEK